MVINTEVAGVFPTESRIKNILAVGSEIPLYPGATSVHVAVLARPHVVAGASHSRDMSSDAVASVGPCGPLASGDERSHTASTLVAGGAGRSDVVDV